MIRIDSTSSTLLATVLHQRCLDDVAGITDCGDTMEIRLPDPCLEQIVIDDLDYERVQYQLE